MAVWRRERSRDLSWTVSMVSRRCSGAVVDLQPTLISAVGLGATVRQFEKLNYGRSAARGFALPATGAMARQAAAHGRVAVPRPNALCDSFNRLMCRWLGMSTTLWPGPYGPFYGFCLWELPQVKGVIGKSGTVSSEK
jgi:hypothetical protein